MFSGIEFCVESGSKVKNAKREESQWAQWAGLYFGDDSFINF